jgi:hypothetical protein
MKPRLPALKSFCKVRIFAAVAIAWLGGCLEVSELVGQIVPRMHSEDNVALGQTEVDSLLNALENCQSQVQIQDMNESKQELSSCVQSSFADSEIACSFSDECNSPEISADATPDQLSLRESENEFVNSIDACAKKIVECYEDCNNESGLRECETAYESCLNAALDNALFDWCPEVFSSCQAEPRDRCEPAMEICESRALGTPH